MPGSVSFLANELEVVSSKPDVEVNSLRSLVSRGSVPSLTGVLVPLLSVLPVVCEHPGTVASVDLWGGVLDHIDVISPIASFSFSIALS